MASHPLRLAVIGAGGFAREVRWLVDEINAETETFEFVGYLVSDPSQPGPHDDTATIVGGLDRIDDGDLAIEAVALGVGDPGARFSIGEDVSLRYPEIMWPSLIHPSVLMDESSASIGVGAVICAGTVLTVNVRVGDFAMINLGCSVGHEADFGKASVINPLVAISGGVEIGDRVLIGTGASVLQYVEVGDDATVGAGAVVTKPVAPGSTVVGVPARPLGD